MAHHSTSRTNGAHSGDAQITQQEYAQEFFRAKTLLQQGQLQQAEAIALTLLQQGANTPEIFNMLGGVALQSGRHEDAILRLQQAVVAGPKNADHHYNLGIALQQTGSTGDAIKSYNRAALLSQGHEMANLQAARLLLQSLEPIQALPYMIRLCQIASENRGYWYLYMQTVRGHALCEEEKALRAPLEKALQKELTAATRSAALRLINCSDWSLELDALFCAQDFITIDQKLSDAAYLKTMQDPLLFNLMTRSHITTPVLDYILTRLRRQLLLNSELAAEAAAQPWIIALWRLCFVNEYVFFTEADEIAALTPLRATIGQALKDGNTPDITVLALLGSYTPLAREAFADALAAWEPGDAVLRTVLHEQIAEPLEEQKRASLIPELIAITDETTRKVRAQYEQNPYPRWRELPDNAPCSLPQYLEDTLVQHHWSALPDTPKHVLIAGCGTGQHAIEVAQKLSTCTVLAVDISRASLAYAQRKAEAMNIENLEFLQADILDLGRLEQQFDAIESVGVLHHMRDPMAGWRVLSKLLRPGGVMKIGLYSQMARRAISLARDGITQQGIGDDDDAIRRYRFALIKRSYEQEDTPLFSAEANLREVFFASDFYALSECRDLLFHVQEHQFTLPQIQDAIAELQLDFLGMHRMDENRHGRFHHTLPATDRSRDFEQWEAYEKEHPDTFQSMYRFWLQKPVM